ncbi:alanine racemase [Prosthecomicrobium sp. N25]|uniref:alanine racemase n=1 Tax=Prosthecomicrobium sp. N25 TaxID=3129254 RepID=UPI00307861F0
MNGSLKQEIARTFGTPALVVDMDVVERNIGRVQALCDAKRVANRPHVKTHKCVELARLQVRSGARGITCQKLGEAEVMADGGLSDILISYNILGEEKTERLGALLARTDVTVAADNPVTVAGLVRAGEIAGRPLPVVVECDTGRERAGVVSPGEAVALARDIAARPALEFAGLMLYPPEDRLAETQRFLDETVEGLAAHGLAPRIVSTGGTPNLLTLGTLRGVTEHRAGTSIFNDRMMMAVGWAGLEDCALTVLTTVVSRAAPERGILDAGSKVFTSDTGWGLDGYGQLIEYPAARLARFSEEHGMLDLARSNERPVVGEIVQVIPNHVCVTVNVVGEMVLVRGGEIVGSVAAEARGRLT